MIDTEQPPSSLDAGPEEVAEDRWTALRRHFPRRTIIISVVLLILVLAIRLYESNVESQADRIREETALALKSTHELFELILEAESSRRSFFINSDDEVLVPYRHAVEEMPRVLDQFGKISPSLLKDPHLLVEAANLVRTRLEMLGSSLAMQLTQNREGLQERIRRKHGRKEANQLREAMRRLEEEFEQTENDAAAKAVGIERIVFWSTAVGVITAIGTLLLAAVSLRRAYASQHELLLRISGREKQYQQLADRLQEVREEERVALARELHDVLGQSLTAMKIDLAGAALQLKNNQSAPALEKMSQVNAEADVCIRSMRRIASELRPPVLDHVGLTAALRSLSSEFSTRTGIAVRFSVTNERNTLSEGQRVALYRIAQESMTNIARHAQACNAAVELTFGESALNLEISDDGKGFNPSRPSNSLGLLGMQERARLVGASLHFRSKPGQGTVVHVSLPYTPVG